MYASLLGISGALHMGIFDQPAQQIVFSNLLVCAATLLVVAGTGHFRDVFGKFPCFHKFEVFLDRPLKGPEDLDAMGLESHQGAGPDATDHYGIHRF